MKRFFKWLSICLAGVAALLFLAAVGLWFYLPYMNTYQAEGQLALPGLKAPVKVARDAKAMPYIHAQSMDDAMLALGFVTAQDRLFQMELLRLVATGRICELAGEKAKPLAMFFKTLGLYRNGRRMAANLGPKPKRFIQRYLDGVNHFIATRQDEYPLEFRLAGIQPTPWTPADCMSLQLIMSWNSSANLKTELAAQAIMDKVGPERAREIFPLNINPDEEPAPPAKTSALPAHTPLNLAGQELLPLLTTRGPLALGSNNWVAGSGLSKGGKPILANDPHLDSRILPGYWYPLAIITPHERLVGVGVPGIPGIPVGRNQHVAWGVTNAYGDCQDLYIETLDPNQPGHYLEGGKSIPFQIVEETLKIRDKEAPGGFREEKVKIRLTKRGPVVSGVLKGLKTGRVLSLRWAPLETLGSRLGLDEAMAAKSAKEFRDAIQGMRHFVLNYVFADTKGDFGWVVIGGLPIRGPGQGAVPHLVESSQDNWLGWIPDNQMPQALNPVRGWLGTCNHMTVTKDYPYYYSNRLAPSWRYRRLIQLMSSKGKKDARDHWRYQRDVKNLHAKLIAPILAKALEKNLQTKPLAELLAGWDYMDDKNAAAPLVFQAVYRQFALEVFTDELGEDLARYMLGIYYFWKERLAKNVVAGDWAWFDDVNTGDKKETRDDIIRRAGLKVLTELGDTLGKDPSTWRWGELHTLNLVSPIARTGPLAGWLGAWARPESGSESTLLRGIYDFNKPYEVIVFDSLRMVVDLADDEKVMAVIPGGATARLFNPHTTDQVNAYMSGRPVYWWFSDKAIKKHTVSVLTLTPESE